MPGMSFDRVSYVIEEEPGPPRRPRRVRLGLLAVATVLSMGALVTGASALTDQSAARQERQIVPHRAFHHHHGLCPHMSGGASAKY
jgi:hypothetical protein